MESPHLSFREFALLLPFATALHIYEEWPEFPRWARRFASTSYSDREYVIAHVAALFGSLTFAAALWAWPSTWLVKVFLLVWLGPGVFWNAVFHASATVIARSYCPGSLTGILVYLPLSIALGWLALCESIVESPTLVALFLGAGLLHTLEVGHNVFKRW